MTWDIFCKVVDNFGDVGVCWRLARQLAAEHGLSVRLWVDDPAPLAALAPENMAGVRVCRWETPLVFDRVAEVVIEAFACALPENYVRAMAGRSPPPVWINLDYLGLADWVAGCHGMASPHPRLPLVKYFFFPGFTAQTGGLLRERDLFVRQAGFRARDELLADKAAPSGALRRLPQGGKLSMAPSLREVARKDRGSGVVSIPVTNDTLLVSLFCYDSAPFAPLLAAWVDDNAPLICLVPPGKPLVVVRACLEGDAPWTIGNVHIIPIPFLTQNDYDELLFACDLNFVRGEDSFIRAQWAGKPFVWQIYPQDADAHLQKLAAFLDRYRPDPCLVHFWQAWNRGDASLKQDWPLLRQALPRLARHNAAWRKKLTGQEDLASALVNFCATRV
ncbi:MAG: elongation factor P maturation arginine rhamnosyltransferase EarP [Zoogloeaceae bacterium]|nr:elongation factor P maturation arginine rhamnosyltransferase EarP [Zoogloeaceae bacterium]